MKQGDLVFCHNTDIVSRAIRWGEWLRFRKGDYYNHVGTLDVQVPQSDDWFVIEAIGHGVTNLGRLSSLVKPGGTYTIVPAPDGVNTDKQMEFLNEQVGDHYGFLTIASIITTLLSPAFINVMLPNTWICSALAAEALRAGGWIHCWPDLYQVNPAQLFEALS
jgi:hypothetical protein